MIYAKPGESAQQFGGTCPDGWVEMQSERPEGNYVASETGGWVIPTPTTAELFKILTDKYESDSAYYRDRMSAALLNDGAGMEAKYAQIRTSFAAVKAQYLADKAALLSGG